MDSQGRAIELAEGLDRLWYTRAMGIEISPVTTDRDLETFLQVPRILRPDFEQNAVPGRWMRPLLDRRRNPYFRHADHQLLIARRDGRIAGRIGLFVDHLCNRTVDERGGLFGLFDCINSPRVAAAIFESAEKWLRERGVDVVRGPHGPAMRLGTGVLVEGHGQLPTPGLTFDPPELGALIEAAGYQPVRDLLAWKLPVTGMPREVVQIAEEERKKRGTLVRSFNPLEYGEELLRIASVMNALPSQGVACAPWTVDELSWTARQLLLVIDPFLVLLVERHGEPAALGMALRNVREILGGRSPKGTITDWLRLGAAVRFGRPRSARIAFLSTSPEHRSPEDQGLGLLALLLYELLGRLRLRGVQWVEVSLVDPIDRPLMSLLEMARAEITKKYRIFEKHLEPTEP